MQFNSIPFLFYFLPAFLAIYYLTPRRGRSAVLAAASCLYYYLACGRQIWPVAVLLEVTALTFLLGLLLKKQDDEVPESLTDFANIMKTAEEDKDKARGMKLTEHYFDEATIAKDQTLKSEIDKPAFPITFNLESFTATHNLLGEKKELPVASLSLPAYNPPTPNRQLVGDLVYVRVAVGALAEA